MGVRIGPNAIGDLPGAQFDFGPSFLHTNEPGRNINEIKQQRIE